MAVRMIQIEICDRCLEGAGECHDRRCTFWTTTPLTADQADALDRQRELNRGRVVIEWLDESG